MTRRFLICLTVWNALAVLAAAQPPRYTVQDLGTLLGGTSSSAQDVNNGGLIAGQATLANGSAHAVLWYKLLMMDIGISGLGGPNSVAFGANEGVQVIGIAESGASDRNGEDFCGFGTHRICLPFLWQWGVMTPLPTLGGQNASTGDNINSRGQIPGFAENTTEDRSCPDPQRFEFKPVVWDRETIQQLPTFPGDREGVAFWINDNGQAVGASGQCSEYNVDLGFYLLPSHALLWDNGTVTDLGNLGGEPVGDGNIAIRINNNGQVVGGSIVPGGTEHAFLWTKKSGMRDLGTLPGDDSSAAAGINDNGDIVGASLDSSGASLRAVLWQNGVMSDLNDLVPSNTRLYLLFAFSINARGEIAGIGVTDGGDVHGFLATPAGAAHIKVNEEESRGGRPAVIPENVRGTIQRGLVLRRLRSRLDGGRR